MHKVYVEFFQPIKVQNNKTPFIALRNRMIIGWLIVK